MIPVERDSPTSKTCAIPFYYRDSSEKVLFLDTLNLRVHDNCAYSFVE